VLNRGFEELTVTEPESVRLRDTRKAFRLGNLFLLLQLKPFLRHSHPTILRNQLANSKQKSLQKSMFRTQQATTSNEKESLSDAFIIPFTPLSKRNR